MIGEVLRHIFGGDSLVAADGSLLVEVGWQHYLLAALICLGLLLLGVVIARLFRWVLRVVARRLAKRTQTKLDDYMLESVANPLHWVLILVTIYFAWRLYPYSHLGLDPYIHGGLFVGAVLVGLRLLRNPLVAFLRWYGEEAERRSGVLINTDFVPLVGKVMTVIFYAIGVIIVLDYFGVDIMALVTTLGVASLAVALAAQETIANMISGFVILADRPFRVGDRLKAAGVFGDVVRIGMRSTAIRTFDNTLISVPNSKISAEYIENFNYPDDRWRVKLTLSLAFGTDPAAAEELLRGVMSETEGVLETPSPAAYLLEIGAYSLNFTLVCWVADHDEGWKVTDRLNRRLLEALTAAGIAIPFPTTRILREPEAEA